MITTRREALDAGRARRQVVPRATHAAFALGGRDPLRILEAQHETRVAELVPLRIARLAQSPFAYFRGTAAVMAHDLRAMPRTGIEVVVCGDAHLANFGLFASPERDLLFDINDFDEAFVGPWEWDLKRLAASAVLGGREHGWTPQRCQDSAIATVRGYRMGLLQFVEMTALERFYARIDAAALHRWAGAANDDVLRRTIERAQRHTSNQLVGKITTATADGTLRIVDDPPVLQRVDAAAAAPVAEIYRTYWSTVRPDVAFLLDQFRLVDVARRIVGVGSVGTRCFIVLLQGPAGEPLFMQIKEAQPSALSTYGGLGGSAGLPGAPDRAGLEGWRVVTSQRVLQAASDPFLGWLSIDGHDYYCRQFHDMKGSFEIATLSPIQFRLYSELCGRALARAHAQSRDAAVIAGYLGTSSRFDEAVATWATCYADQVEVDFAGLLHAVETGRFPSPST